MTSPDDHTTPADTGASTAGGPSLSRLLETWQAWNGREMFARAEARARAAGDAEQAARLRDLVARDREVAALDALAAQHEMSSLLAGWEWHTVRAAREQGATWADIAHATRSEPEQARAAYLDVIDRQELAATRYGGMPFDDAADYRAAAGRWHDELHPDTPTHVVEQIEGAITRDDVDELAALRGAWWNPHHVPPVTVFPAVTEEDLAVAAQAQAAAERGDHAEARRLMGIDDAQVAALLDAQAAMPRYAQIAPGVAVPAGDREDGYRNHTVEEAVAALAPLLGSRTAAERAVAEYLAEHGPPVGPNPYGAVFEDDDLIAIAYPTGVNPWTTIPGAERVPHTHMAVHNRGNLDVAGDLGVAIDASDAEPDALEVAQDAADRALQAEIEAEVAEADPLYGQVAFDDPDPARTPRPEQFDDPWHTLGPAVTGINPAATDESGNDLAGDVERVLAHLRVQNTAHRRWAGPLWDMPEQRWDASIAALRAGGYEISTSISTHGDRASNGTAYWLATDAGRNQPGLNQNDDAIARHQRTDTRAEQDGGWWAQARSADPDAPVVTVDDSGFYPDTEIAVIGDALAVGDTERAAWFQDRPWLAQGVTVDVAHFQVTDDTAARGGADERTGDQAAEGPVMPEWMREQARRTQAEHADRTAPPARPDDRAEIAARVAALREQLDGREPGPTGVRECDWPARSVPSCLVEVDEEARREQLTRWHTDDTAAGDSDSDSDGAEATRGAPFIVLDDGPGPS